MKLLPTILRNCSHYLIVAASTLSPAKFRPEAPGIPNPLSPCILDPMDSGTFCGVAWSSDVWEFRGLRLSST